MSITNEDRYDLQAKANHVVGRKEGLTVATAIIAAIRPDHRIAWGMAAVAVPAVAIARIPALLSLRSNGTITDDRAAFSTWVWALVAWLAACLWWVTRPWSR